MTRICSFLFILLLVFINGVAGNEFSSLFSPVDSYLIDCGSMQSTVLDDGRTFISDSSSTAYLSSDEDSVIISDDKTNVLSLSPSPVSSLFLPLYLTARIFPSQSLYNFPIISPGRHWLRLYFHPLQNKLYNLSSATFSVKTDDFVLLSEVSVKEAVFKEYLINITNSKFTLTFSPLQNSIAFINGIELVSAPDSLIPHAAASVVPFGGEFVGLSNHAIEVMFRLNVGGPMVSPKNDTLSRIWSNDSPFMAFPEGVENVSVPSDMILYTEYEGGGATPLIAPYSVYSTADQMADSDTNNPNFNLTWEMSVDPSYSYLIRLHFCDIVSKALDELYFNVYVNGFMGISGLDLSSITSGLVVPYYKDFVLNASNNSSVVIQIGPSFDIESSVPNAILNGLEVMKLSNSDGSLDGLLYPNETMKTGLNHVIKVVAVVGFVLGIIALGLLLIRLTTTLLRQHRIPKGYQKQTTFSSWLLSLNSNNQFSFLSSSRSKSSTSSTFMNPVLNLGRRFTLIELRHATNNFSENAVIGVGGFGKVYLGEVETGTRVAIKRGSASSSQGIHEFQTEIHLLSKLRHIHLVSLIGYCDEQSEMILVYEYMENGPLRDHLYGSNRPPLSWKQKLEICIGAARGLHYLHTGSTQGKIIHRDVKTTNILLDDKFVAKVSDFGLSKTGPATLDQTHVSTAVKGSFGYLDPEYFRRQQLTEKSDVYSFGVVLFEVLCGRPALDPRLPREEVNLAEFAKKQHAKGAMDAIIDPVIAGKDSVIKYVDAAVKCLGEYGIDRPSMGDVLWNLEYALQLQEIETEMEKLVDDSPVLLLDEFQGR